MDVDGYALGCLREGVDGIYFPRPRHILRQLILHDIEGVCCVGHPLHSVISKVSCWTIHGKQFLARFLTLELAHQCLNSVFDGAAALSDLMTGAGVSPEVGDMMTRNLRVAVLRRHA